MTARRGAQRWRLLAGVAALGLALPLLVRWGVPWPAALAWPVDLAVHWQWLWSALWVVALAGLAATGHRRWLAGLPLVVLPLYTATARLDGAAAPDSISPRVSVATANVNLDNIDPTPLLRWARDHDVDLLALQEVSPPYAAQLATLARDYPHQQLLPDHGPWGLGLLSRHPLLDVAVLRLPDGPVALLAVVRTPAGPVTVAVVHTLPPIFGPASWQSRDRDLARLLQTAREPGHPALVIGDLNASAWSSGLRLAQAAGFRRAQGLAPTWPAATAAWPWLPWGIPIDHVLAGEGCRVLSTETGPRIGSDHLPVLARLSLPSRDPPVAAAQVGVGTPFMRSYLRKY